MENRKPVLVKAGHLNSHDTMTDQFAKWIYDASKNGKVISKAVIAREISRIKGGGAVTEGNVASWIGHARIYCENHFNCTLWNVAGEGWRASSERETAVYYMRCVKKTISWADRTLNLQVISKRSEIPHAIKEVFCDAEGGIKKLSQNKKRFFEIWVNMLKKEKESGEPRLLAASN